MCRPDKINAVLFSDTECSPAVFFRSFIGVLTTYLFSVIIPKIPAVYIVILRFIGQMFTSAAIDYIYLNIFSKGKIIGGALFLIELTLNAKADQKYAQAHLKLSRNGIH